MSVTVNMPQLGETVTEGTILSWAKQPGDEIAEDEVLLEISTDKVDTEIPSPAAGIVREILVPEGETVSVGTPLVVIAEPGEAEADPDPVPPVAATPPEPVSAEPPPPAPTPEPAPAPVEAVPTAPVAVPAAGEDSPRRGILSPVVRKLAAEYDLDLDLVPGSGAGGRITRKDVMTFIETRSADVPPAQVTLEPAPEPVTESPAEQAEPALESAAPVAATPEPVSAAPESAEEAPEPAVAPSVSAAEPQPAAADEAIELSRLRRRIAENMIHAKQTAAHVWTSVEVNYENVERVRQAHRAGFKDREGFSLTYMPFLARATMDALRAYPIVNSSLSLEDNTYTLHNNIHLGIAVDLNEGGLLVTTIREADQMAITGLAREIRRLATKTRSGRIDLDEITGSTFTITNPGPFGSFMSAPIINVPNVAILSTDTVTKRPTVVSLPDGTDGLAIRHIGYLGLTWDHRAFDGSTAVLFLKRIKDNLQTWDWEQELS
jgi:2-oxoglutarate dehydrogenase E2 component (dihydrolipoamide succinyltransferase)